VTASMHRALARLAAHEAGAAIDHEEFSYLEALSLRLSNVADRQDADHWAAEVQRLCDVVADVYEAVYEDEPCPYEGRDADDCEWRERMGT
jgi:hypothetical protein